MSRLWVWLLICAGGGPLEAEQQSVRAGAPLRVFLDCSDCFADYLRTEIRWVDFVRQREEADVHLLSSSRETGGGRCDQDERRPEPRKSHAAMMQRARQHGRPFFPGERHGQEL